MDRVFVEDVSWQQPRRNANDGIDEDIVDASGVVRDALGCVDGIGKCGRALDQSPLETSGSKNCHKAGPQPERNTIAESRTSHSAIHCTCKASFAEKTITD